MTWLLAFIPKKYLIGGAIIAFLAVAVAGGYFYLTAKNSALEAKVAQAQIALKQAEIDNLNSMLDLQRKSIENLKKDAEVQKKRLDAFNNAVELIREKTIADLAEISNTDIVEEAKSNAPALEKLLNDRTQRMLDNIDASSRLGKK